MSSMSEEREALRSAVADYLDANYPIDKVQRIADGKEAVPADAWLKLSQGLGLAGLVIPEEFGGQGAGYAELGAVLQEFGRTLAPLPMLSSAALGTLPFLLATDDTVRRPYLEALASGEATAALALTEAAGEWPVTAHETTALQAGENWHVSGSKSFVLDNGGATFYVVSAQTENGVGIFVIDGADVTREALNAIDLTRAQSSISFEKAPAIALAVDAGDTIKQLQELAAILISSEQLGGATAVMNMFVEYAKIRVQFGRIIGSFQAIKHMCANTLVEVEKARGAAEDAADKAAAGQDDLALSASLAKVSCSEAFTNATLTNIRVHGGIGYTWEHPAHLYFRRSRSSSALFGTPAQHREALLVGLGY
ncbi:MAG: acyl-CoA dehydrogenase family protein [Actinomycetota bacterium]|nr:acyl-CoA dehydrogenase family protein [Actinomycetota bacterium]